MRFYDTMPLLDGLKCHYVQGCSIVGLGIPRDNVLEIDLGMLPMHSIMDCMQSGILSRMSMPIGKMWDLIISCPLNYLHNIVEKLGANIITILNSTDCQFQIDCIYYIYWPNCALIVEPKEYLSRILAEISVLSMPLRWMRKSALRHCAV